MEPEGSLPFHKSPPPVPILSPMTTIINSINLHYSYSNYFLTKSSCDCNSYTFLFIVAKSYFVGVNLLLSLTVVVFNTAFGHTLEFLEGKSALLRVTTIIRLSTKQNMTSSSHDHGAVCVRILYVLLHKAHGNKT
jgi:hypothetical protein